MTKGTQKTSAIQLKPVFDGLKNNLKQGDIQLDPFKEIILDPSARKAMHSDRDSLTTFNNLFEKSLNTLENQITHASRQIVLNIRPDECYLTFGDIKVDVAFYSTYQAYLSHRLALRTHIQTRILNCETQEERLVEMEIWLRLLDKFLDARNYYDACTVWMAFLSENVSGFSRERLSDRAKQIITRIEALHESKFVETITAEDIYKKITTVKANTSEPEKQSEQRINLIYWLEILKENLDEKDTANVLMIFDVLSRPEVAAILAQYQASLPQDHSSALAKMNASTDAATKEKWGTTAKKIKKVMEELPKSLAKCQSLKNKFANKTLVAKKPLTITKTKYWAVLIEEMMAPAAIPALPDLRPFEFNVDSALKGAGDIVLPKNQAELSALKADEANWNKLSTAKQALFEEAANEALWKSYTKAEQVIKIRKANEVAVRHVKMLENLQIENQTCIDKTHDVYSFDNTSQIKALYKKLHGAHGPDLERIMERNGVVTLENLSNDLQEAFNNKQVELLTCFFDLRRELAWKQFQKKDSKAVSKEKEKQQRSKAIELAKKKDNEKMPGSEFMQDLSKLPTPAKTKATTNLRRVTISENLETINTVVNPLFAVKLRTEPSKNEKGKERDEEDLQSVSFSSSSDVDGQVSTSDEMILEDELASLKQALLNGGVSTSSSSSSSSFMNDQVQVATITGSTSIPKLKISPKKTPDDSPPLLTPVDEDEDVYSPRQTASAPVSLRMKPIMLADTRVIGTSFYGALSPHKIGEKLQEKIEALNAAKSPRSPHRASDSILITSPRKIATIKNELAKAATPRAVEALSPRNEIHVQVGKLVSIFNQPKLNEIKQTSKDISSSTVSNAISIESEVSPAQTNASSDPQANIVLSSSPRGVDETASVVEASAVMGMGKENSPRTETLGQSSTACTPITSNDALFSTEVPSLNFNSLGPIPVRPATPRKVAGKYIRQGSVHVLEQTEVEVNSPHETTSTQSKRGLTRVVSFFKDVKEKIKNTAPGHSSPRSATSTSPRPKSALFVENPLKDFDFTEAQQSGGSLRLSNEGKQRRG